VDPPLIGGGELPNEVLLDEELDIMFIQAAGREGPHGRSFSLDLDGDILDGLLGHSGGLVGLRLVAASYGRLRSDRISE
jgi:hypothetical protein